MQKMRLSGFSLIEVLVALLVIGLGFVAVSKFQGSTVKNASLSAQRAEAINIAQAKVEKLRHFAKTDGVPVASIPAPKLVDGNTSQYTVTWSLTDSASLLNSLDLKVVVTWPDAARNGVVSEDTTVALSTVINTQVPVTAVLSDSVPVPAPTNDPTVDIVMCACSGSMGKLSHMSARRQRNDFFVKVGGGHKHWTVVQEDAICDSCCSLPAAKTHNSGGSGNDYVCSVRQGQCDTRWQW